MWTLDIRCNIYENDEDKIIYDGEFESFEFKKRDNEIHKLELDKTVFLRKNVKYIIDIEQNNQPDVENPDHSVTTAFIEKGRKTVTCDGIKITFSNGDTDTTVEKGAIPSLYFVRHK